MTRVTIAIFDNVTQLDFAGPSQVFSRTPGTQVVLAAMGTSIRTDCGWSVIPEVRLSDVVDTDVLVVPGGEGAFDAMLDESFMDEITRLAASANLVTSVCTGSFILGAAGLLAGRKATSHWSSESMLAEFGAIPTRARLVHDGNVITGGGVTAGIDFALAIVRDLQGEEVARRVQLQLEYDPAPPFPDAGSPAGAPAELVTAGIASARSRRLERVTQAASRL